MQQTSPISPFKLQAALSTGIFITTLGPNMPTFGMLMMLTVMQMQSGGSATRESMPKTMQNISVRFCLRFR